MSKKNVIKLVSVAYATDNQKEKTNKTQKQLNNQSQMRLTLNFHGLFLIVQKDYRIDTPLGSDVKV